MNITGKTRAFTILGDPVAQRRAEAGVEMLVQQVPEYLRFFGFDDLAASVSADVGGIRALLDAR